MDSRSLLFFVVVFAALFCSNFYFSERDRAARSEWLKKQEEKKRIAGEKLEREVSARTANSSDLPLVPMYADKSERSLFGYGIVSEERILTVLENEGTVPETVYVEGKAYRKSEVSSMQPRLATFSRTAKPLFEIARLPSHGRFDLQLVATTPSEEGAAQITLAEFSDREFIVPLRAPESHAIALVRINDQYLPFAVYDHSNKVFSILEENGRLAGMTYRTTGFRQTVDADQPSSEQQFFVLENAYQQLVLTNVGGSVVEINLPFRDSDHPDRPVLPIDFDRRMEEQSPRNALFPAMPFMSAQDSQLQEGTLGGYYPLLRREARAAEKRYALQIPHRYNAFNIVSNYPEMAELSYAVTHFDKTAITFEAKQPHRKITKTFRLSDDPEKPYVIDLDVQVSGDGRNLFLTSGVPEVEWISGGPAPQLSLQLTRRKTEVEKIDLPKESISDSSIRPDWIANSNGFFGIILDPQSDTEAGFKAEFVPGALAPSRLIQIDKKHSRYQANNLPGYQTLLPLKASGGSMKFRIYAGPFDGQTLQQVDKAFTDPVTGLTPGYAGCQTFHGWFAFISAPIANYLLLPILKGCHAISGSWAISIILLTAVLRLLLYPLNAWSMRSMRMMQQIAPEVTKIQERHKKDPQKAQLEIMNLYRDKGVNPLSGCFPMLIQMPFLIGMFDLLKSTFALRGASFIPGWIDDLASPDVLLRWDFSIFFIGTELHVLPVLLGGVMFAQQMISNTLPKDSSTWTDQQRQQRTMGNMMTVLFTVMFYHFPSGLNLYWLSSMILNMGQQWVINRQLGPVSQTIDVTPKGKGKKKK